MPIQSFFVQSTSCFFAATGAATLPPSNDPSNLMIMMTLSSPAASSVRLIAVTGYESWSDPPSLPVTRTVTPSHHDDFASLDSGVQT